MQSTEDIQRKLTNARSLQCMTEGMALYEAKHYSAALVHFRKALLFDPANADAARYAEYAAKLDETLYDRFSKLE